MTEPFVQLARDLIARLTDCEYDPRRCHLHEKESAQWVARARYILKLAGKPVPEDDGRATMRPGFTSPNVIAEAERDRLTQRLRAYECSMRRAANTLERATFAIPATEGFIRTEMDAARTDLLSELASRGPRAAGRGPSSGEVERTRKDSGGPGASDSTIEGQPT